MYDSISPVVKEQVASQIKVRDLSHASVSVKPANFAGWSDARSELIVEAKRPLKARKQKDLAAAGDDSELRADIDARYGALESEIEANVDHLPLDLSFNLGVEYNFLSQ